MTQAVLILGATSWIGRAISHAMAGAGHPLFLAARDESELARLAQDYKIRYGVDVHTGLFDADSCSNYDLYIQNVIKQMGGLQGVVIAYGYMGNQDKAIKDSAEANRIISRNFVSACSILSPCAEHLERQGYGFIIGVSSTIAERGRQGSYVYGAAKAGLNTFLQGLRNRLYHSGVHVLTIKLGSGDSPAALGEKIMKALHRGRNQVYLPWYRGTATLLLKQVPEFVFKRLKL